MNAPNWRRLRQGTQTATLLIFVASVVTTYMLPRAAWSTLFVRFDPLLMITSTIAGRTFVTGAWLALLTLVITLIFGRAWCGWLCPLGTALDWFTPGKRTQRRLAASPPPEGWRVGKYLLLLVVLFAALLGSQTLLFLDPITISTRTVGAVLWPALGHAVYTAEDTLYGVEALWPALDVVDERVVYPLFRGVRPIFVHVLPVFLLFAGIVALNWRAPRFWCRYLCPLGGLLGFVSKWALVRRRVDDGCIGCTLCAQRCPTGTIDPRHEYRSDPAECTVCMDCVTVCPQEGVAFRRVEGWGRSDLHAYDPRRRHVLLGLGGAAVGVTLLGLEPPSSDPAFGPLRPPGARLVDFADLCIRCGLCVRACPTQGLQPTLLEGGWSHVFTPQLVPRLGYCLYGCTACASVCPTGAIPILDVAEKQRTSIGLASVNRGRCLPWAYDTPCIVCEEMCPVPQKAITLEEVAVVTEAGERIVLQRPLVARERCIGCGICEHKCPMEGEAAIRVFAVA